MQKAMVTAAVVMALVVGLAGPAMAAEPGALRASAVRLAAEAGAAQNEAPQERRRSMGRTAGGILMVLFSATPAYAACDGFDYVGDPSGGCVAGAWASLGMVVGGVLLATIWADVPVDARADRHGVSVNRSFGW